jgi:hypothetical protein
VLYGLHWSVASVFAELKLVYPPPTKRTASALPAILYAVGKEVGWYSGKFEHSAFARFVRGLMQRTVPQVTTHSFLCVRCLLLAADIL